VVKRPQSPSSLAETVRFTARAAIGRNKAAVGAEGEADDKAAAGEAVAGETATGTASGTKGITPRRRNQVVVWLHTSLSHHTAPEGYGMEQVLLEMFEQARKIVVETDRRLAE
jgi:hypothetical protein